MLFTSPRSCPASGLRLEIAAMVDKKKSEFYFSSALKKILTEKAKRGYPGKTKIIWFTPS
jgi:hypothetical protein